MKFKVAVIQFAIAQFDPEKNIARAEKFIAKASTQGAHIIVFPEDFITGPILGKKEFVDFDGKYRKIFQVFAKKYQIDIVMGSVIEGEQTGSYNTCHYIDASGKIRGTYRKINLWLPERKYLTPGNEVVVFNTKFGKIGLIICWDLIFPEIFRKMVIKGVNIVFCPSYWTIEDAGMGTRYNTQSEITSVNALCTARAFENSIAVVYANSAGRLDWDTIHAKLIGQSQITLPFIGPTKHLINNKEAMFIQELDLDILKKAEWSYKTRQDVKNRTL